MSRHAARDGNAHEFWETGAGSRSKARCNNCSVLFQVGSAHTGQHKSPFLGKAIEKPELLPGETFIFGSSKCFLHQRVGFCFKKEKRGQAVPSLQSRNCVLAFQPRCVSSALTPLFCLFAFSHFFFFGCLPVCGCSGQCCVRLSD